MSFSIQISIDEPITGFEDKESYATAASIASIIESTVCIRFNEDEISHRTPLIIFFGELTQSIAESMFLGVNSNIYLDSTPIAWVHYEKCKFTFVYYVGQDKRSCLVDQAVIISEIAKIANTIRSIFLRYENIDDVLSSLRLYRSFGSDLLHSLLSPSN